MSLRWSWLAAPYVLCAVLIAGVALSAALVRGDRVLRLGVLGAAVSALPWAMAQAAAACTHDPDLAWRILRVGQGPIAFVGPCLVLVLLGVSGQLERYRWVARTSGVIGAALLVLCWTTMWTVPGVQRIASGMYYPLPGPLTGIHVSQLVIWLVIGIVIARRSSPHRERKRTLRVFVAVLVFVAVGSFDSLLLYGVWGVYPIAWFPACVAAVTSMYLVIRTDFVRPQGFDRATGVELLATFAAFVTLAIITAVFGPSLAVVAGGAIAYAAATGIAWTLVRAKPVRVAAERELEQFVARVTTLDDETKIAERLGALWGAAVPGLTLRTLHYASSIDDDAARWFVRNTEALAAADLATMKVGPIRDKLEALARDPAAVLVPLVDRDELVGLVEARYELALREGERGLLADSARAAARALTFVGLTRAAARERETAREVEIADALRLQASASRATELRHWSVGAEYHGGLPPTDAGWSAIELADGRLAILVTSAQASGVAGALATSAITGAFAAATTDPAITLDALRAAMPRELPATVFVAIVDSETRIDVPGHPAVAALVVTAR